MTATGELRFGTPEELDVTLLSSFPGLGRQRSKTIVIGSKTYSWESGLDYPGGDKWVESSTSSAGGASSALPLVGAGTGSELLAQLAAHGGDVVSRRTVVVGGVRYTALGYRLSPAALAQTVIDQDGLTHATPARVRRLEAVYPRGFTGTIYLGATGRLWRVTARTFERSDGESATDAASVTYFDYGLAVHLSPPPARDVERAPTVTLPPATTTVPTTTSSSSSSRSS